MLNFCPKCGAPLAGVSAEAKFCPKCGAALETFAATVDAPVAAPTTSAPAQPVFAAPAKPSATYIFDLPSRMQYIIAMVCLAVGIVASVMMNSDGMYDGETLNPKMGLIFLILYVGGMYYVCMVIKKMLSYKRSSLGLWATRALFAISLASIYLLIYMGYEVVKLTNYGTYDDYINFLSQIKTMFIIYSIVYTSVFAVLGWAIIGLKDHAKGGRWFMWTGAALILCTVLSFIFQMYDVINVEDAMTNDESSSWLESMPWEFVVLFAVFVVGYMFLSENEVRGRYSRVADNSVKWSVGILPLLVLWFLGIRVIVLVVLAVYGFFMIKYVPLTSAASANTSSAGAPKEGNTEPAVVADAKPKAESSSAAVPSTPAPMPTSTSTPAAESVKDKVTNPEVEKILKEDSK